MSRCIHVVRIYLQWYTPRFPIHRFTSQEEGNRYIRRMQRFPASQTPSILTVTEMFDVDNWYGVFGTKVVDRVGSRVSESVGVYYLPDLQRK